MYFIVDKAGKQQGPFEIGSLLSQGLTPETLVWKQGMADWTPASQVEELSTLFSASAPTPPPYASGTFTPQPPTPPNNGAGYGNGHNNGYDGGAAPQQNQNLPPKPDNYLVWTILSTVCCCLPFGIYAIYCAAQVDSYYRVGDYNKAVEYSGKAKQWAIIGAILGLISSCIYGAINFATLASAL